MNFTREPIIETIISPKDGFKLLVRSSKAGSAEEYFVDALEVVSFGRAFFFRSLERPKAFLVPTSDYEVLEVKETRVALKNVSHERSIKIGGGREGPPRHRERAPQPPREEELSVASDEGSSEESGTVETGTEPRLDKRRDRRRHRRRRGDDQEWTDRSRGQEGQPREAEAARPEEAGEGGGAQDEAKVSSSMFSSLFPPPPTLISETLSRYKDKEASEGTPTEEKREKHPPVEKDEPKEPSREDDAGSTPLHRVHTPVEAESFTTTHFSPLNGNGDFNQFF